MTRPQCPTGGPVPPGAILDVKFMTETTGPWIRTFCDRAHDADLSMRGLNDLHVKQMPLEAA